MQCAATCFWSLKKKKPSHSTVLLLLLSLNYHQSKDCVQGGSVGKESAAVSITVLIHKLTKTTFWPPSKLQSRPSLHDKPKSCHLRTVMHIPLRSLAGHGRWRPCKSAGGTHPSAVSSLWPCRNLHSPLPAVSPPPSCPVFPLPTCNGTPTHHHSCTRQKQETVLVLL